MMCCHKCGVKIEDFTNKCPLCMRSVDQIDAIFEQDYALGIAQKKRKLFMKIVLFITIVALSTAGLIWVLVPGSLFWIIIALISVLYFAYVSIAIVKTRKNIGRMIFWNTIGLALFAILMDMQTGRHNWAVTYVIPGLFFLSTTIISILMIAKPIASRDYAVHQIVTAAFGVLSVFLFFTKLTTVKWPVLVVVIYCALTLLGFFLFKEQAMGVQIKKHFHL